MKILEKDMMIKVLGIRQGDIRASLIESNLFIHHGKSLNQWYELFSLKQSVVRQIKIEKISKKYYLSKRLDRIMDTIKNDIMYYETK